MTKILARSILIALGQEIYLAEESLPDMATALSGTARHMFFCF